MSEFVYSSDVYGLQPEATRRLLTSFFAPGEADDPLYTYHAVNFKAGLGFPLVAKLIVVVIALVIALLVALARFVVQRLQRRKIA